uniref:Uncharacterized protein n=1 Tax=Oryza punctata TaxID=4537 RepID=A0A0E0JM37_ORYPU
MLSIQGVVVWRPSSWLFDLHPVVKVLQVHTHHAKGKLLSCLALLVSNPNQAICCKLN